MPGSSDIFTGGKVFDAVRIDHDAAGAKRPGAVLRAFGLGSLGAKPETPSFSYRVLTPQRSATDKRSEPRTRTRLRTGKIVNARHEFLTECRIFDRSRGGARLELKRPLPAEAELHLFDDETGKIYPISAIWHGKQVIGVMLGSAEQPDASPLGRSHYGLR